MDQCERVDTYASLIRNSEQFYTRHGTSPFATLPRVAKVCQCQAKSILMNTWRRYTFVWYIFQKFRSAGSQYQQRSGKWAAPAAHKKHWHCEYIIFMRWRMGNVGNAFARVLNTRRPRFGTMAFNSWIARERFGSMWRSDNRKWILSLATSVYWLSGRHDLWQVIS